MVYLINSIFSILYFYSIKNLKKINFLVFLPVFFIWTLILGFQYGVGTDYFSYLDIFINKNNIQLLYLNQKEYIFYYLVKILNNFSDNGQILFIVISCLENIIFYIFLKELIKNKFLEINKIYIFIFVFLCFGTSFYNQMNTLRQYFNIYLFSLGIIYLLINHKLTYIFFIFLGNYIHKSMFYLLPFYWIKFFIKKIKIKYIHFILITSFLFLFFPLNNILENLVLNIPRYKYYVGSKFFIEVPIYAQITKIIFIPFYLDSLKILKKEINFNKIFLLKIGIIFFSIRIFCLKNIMLTRMSEYFLILSIFPIYYLLIYYYDNKKYKRLLLLMIMILSLFIVKTLIFPRGEYLYRSWFFN